jgi:DNA-binding MarR family transcriptional regulator
MDIAPNPSHFFLSRLLARSYRILKTINSTFLESLDYHQVKIGHIMLMMNLSDGGSTSMELARRVQISKQAMSKLVHELAQKGFLEVIKHPEDQRATLVKSTLMGDQFLKDLDACRRHVESEFAQVIGQDKLENLKEILFLMVSHFENQPMMNFMNESLAKTKI